MMNKMNGKNNKVGCHCEENFNSTKQSSTFVSNQCFNNIGTIGRKVEDCRVGVSHLLAMTRSGRSLEFFRISRKNRDDIIYFKAASIAFSAASQAPCLGSKLSFCPRMTEKWRCPRMTFSTLALATILSTSIISESWAGCQCRFNNSTESTSCDYNGYVQGLTQVSCSDAGYNYSRTYDSVGRETAYSSGSNNYIYSYESGEKITVEYKNGVKKSEIRQRDSTIAPEAGKVYKTVNYNNCTATGCVKSQEQQLVYDDKGNLLTRVTYNNCNSTTGACTKDMEERYTYDDNNMMTGEKYYHCDENDVCTAYQEKVFFDRTDKYDYYVADYYCHEDNCTKNGVNHRYRTGESTFCSVSQGNCTDDFPDNIAASVISSTFGSSVTMDDFCPSGCSGCNSDKVCSACKNDSYELIDGVCIGGEQDEPIVEPITPSEQQGSQESEQQVSRQTSSAADCTANDKYWQEGSCVASCGPSFRLNDGWCDRQRYTPAEAAAVLNDDNNNSVTITFKK